MSFDVVFTIDAPPGSRRPKDIARDIVYAAAPDYTARLRWGEDARFGEQNFVLECAASKQDAESILQAIKIRLTSAYQDGVIRYADWRVVESGGARGLPRPPATSNF